MNRKAGSSPKLLIGTSGYSYDHWANGIFYPPKLPKGKWFEFYETQFSAVELNITFYRLPKPEIFKGWYRRSRKDFRFVVKGSRYITHIKRLKDPEEPLKRFFASTSPLKEKLACVLWQLPPHFPKDTDRLIKFLKTEQKLRKKFTNVRTAFEFRDESWFNDEIADILSEFKITYCMADWPPFSKGLKIPETGPILYLRKHGAHSKRLYEGGYSLGELKEDASLVKQCMKKGKDVFVFFNNDAKGFAPKNAKQLSKLIH